MIPQHCDHCKFYEKTNNHMGKCKLNPPVTFPNYIRAVFPVVEYSDWCGKFEPTEQSNSGSEKRTDG